MAAAGGGIRFGIAKPWLVLFLTAAFLAGLLCGVALAQSSGAERMGARLARIAAETDPGQNAYMNARRAAMAEADLAARGEAEAPPSLVLALAQELLNSGRTGDAIARFDQLEVMVAGRPGTAAAKRADLRLQRAVAHLRRAEDDNCVLHHNPRSCLFPIAGSGVHGERRGSRAAVRILTELLEENPADLRARWLINVAYMTLGEYPDGVPPRFLLHPDLFKSEADPGYFPNIAGDLGLDVDDRAGGSILDDFDGDGDLDIVASSMGFDSPLRYFRNDGEGGFTDRSAEAGLAGENGGLNIMQADYDNDGRPDILVLRGAWMGRAGRYPNSLLHNDGKGTFSDVTEEAGMLSFHPTQTATWLDFDGDGWLDLFIGNETTPGETHACELFRNNRNGTFTECAGPAGVATRAFVKGVASGDFNDDGRPDLYVSILGAPNVLFRNDGPAPPGSDPRAWRFTDVAAAAGVAGPLFSFPTWFWDYDNDGREDLFVSGYRIDNVGDFAADALGLPHRGELPRLYRNNGDGTFADVTRAARLDRLLLTMGSNYGDLDNDGWLDFYAGTGNPDLGVLIPDRMFRNAEGRVFQDVTTSGGFGSLQKGHAVSFGDLDNDGDQDIYHVIGGAVESDHFRNALFENPGHGNHWVVLRLEGVRSNRSAIGARIKVVAATPDGERAVQRTVRSGGSFGASPLRQEIGLGAATRIMHLEIRWPSGLVQVIRDLAVDERYHVREGEDGAKPFRLEPSALGKKAA